MPEIMIRTEGEGGAFRDVFARYRRIIELNQDIPLRIETLDRGMAGGKPSVAFVIELPQIGEVVLAQTSVKLFQMAAYTTLAKYGDMTAGAITGLIDKGDATLRFSDAVDCPNCRNQIPSSFKYCMECGHAMARSAAQ